MSLSHNRHKKLIAMIQADGKVRIRDLMLQLSNRTNAQTAFKMQGMLLLKAETL